MLRFTLHRPSQDSAVSTCCHAMSCRDVSGRVHVGVRAVPAGRAHEARLALATLGSDVLAGVTGLRRVRSFDFLDPAWRLLLQPAREQTPTGCQDAPVEAGLLCDVPARILHGSPRRAGHAFDVEVLEADHVEPCGQVGAGLLGPVLAPVAVFGFHPLRSGPSPSGGGWTRRRRGRVCAAAAGPARLPSGSARQGWSSRPWTAPPRA
jgi:hypothetical protein